MRKTVYFAISAALVVFFACCGSAKGVTALPSEAPGSLYFINEALPALRVPDEVGGRTENPADETGSVRTAFREAYLEALFRGVELGGVLGSDRVNPWPEGEPQSWSQNWNKAEGEANSWGIPNLVLALGHYAALAELPGLSAAEKALKRVFTVHGPILDMYGKSSGYARSNGITGYGFPLGEVSFLEGMAVQRFSRGRMIVSAEGTRFSFEDDSFHRLLENLTSVALADEFGGRDISQEISDAFAYAWAFTFSEKEGASDGPVTRVSFSKPWLLPADEGAILLNGFYYKSYNDGQDVLVLIDSPDLPRRVHHLSGLFLDTILSQKRLRGLDMAQRLGSAEGIGLGRSLAEGFAVYGPPLSDLLPLPITREGSTQSEAPAGNNTPGEDTPGEDTPGEALSGDEPAAAEAPQTESSIAAGGEADTPAPRPIFLRAQRFARGWMISGA